MEKQIRNKSWREAEREYALADADYRDAEARRKAARAKLEKLMEAAGLVPPVGESVYAEGDVLRVRLTMSAGRVTFLKDKLFEDHPEIDRADYEKVGKPSQSFHADVLPGAVVDRADSAAA